MAWIDGKSVSGWWHGGEIGWTWGEKTHAELAKDVARDLGRVRIPPHGALDDGQTQAPDVALDVVGSVGKAPGAGRQGASADALGRHVALAANVGFGDAGHEVPGHAKVADLDLSVGVDQDVGGLDVAVDDVVVIFERLEAEDRGVCNLAQDVFWDPPRVQLVDAAAVHVLDAHVDGAFLVKGAVKVDNVRGDAFV